MSAIDTIIETGNALVSAVQGAGDMRDNSAGSANNASGYFSLLGVLSSMVNSNANTPFAQALSAGFGINVSAAGLTLAVTQALEAKTQFDAVNSNQNSTSAEKDAAAKNLSDKIWGAVASAGALIGSIPHPTTKTIGNVIWLGASLYQQVENGGAQAAVDFLSAIAVETFADFMDTMLPNPENAVPVDTSGEMTYFDFESGVGVTYGSDGALLEVFVETNNEDGSTTTDYYDKDGNWLDSMTRGGTKPPLEESPEASRMGFGVGDYYGSLQWNDSVEKADVTGSVDAASTSELEARSIIQAAASFRLGSGIEMVRGDLIESLNPPVFSVGV